MALLISVQDGEFDLNSASPMRRFGDNFLRAAVKQMRVGSDVDLKSSPLPGEAELLAKWLHFNVKKDTAQEEQVVRQRIMPNVVGMSLRKALLELMPCKAGIEIKGAGRVVEQEPSAGESCGDRVLLRLASGSVEK